MIELVATVRRALQLLNKRLRRRWFLLLPWAALSGVLEMAATGGMLILIRLIGDSPGSEATGSLAKLARFLGTTPDLRFSALFAVSLALLFFVKNLLRVAESYAQQRSAADAAAWVSAGLLERYLHGPYNMHLRRNSSEMLHVMSGSAQDVTFSVLPSVAALISEVFIVAGIISVLVAQLPAAAFAAAGAAAAVMILLLRATQHRHTVWGKTLHEKAVQILQRIRQSLASVKEAKVLGRESYFVDQFASSLSATYRIAVLRQTLEVVPRLVVETTFVATLAILIVAAWLRPEGSGGLFSTLGIFAYGGLRLLPSLHLIVYRFNNIGSGKAAVDAVLKDWNELAPAVGDGAGSGNLPALARDIVFDQVTFQYESAAEPALNDISFSIRRGESIGIVGPTGAGKSTLVDLMLGLLEPSSGTIRVDGRNIQSGVRAWQRQIGYVPQSIYLTDDTIRRNIALGVNDGEIDESRVRDAARAAQLESFLKTLPDGLDTLTGERGVKLSGGERQRIAVARALYRRPSILIFDEATAALDNATEKELTATIQGLHGRATLIFIAHRLSTVQDCDRLMFLRDGAIPDSGSYTELMSRNEEFQHLASLGLVVH